MRIARHGVRRHDPALRCARDGPREPGRAHRGRARPAHVGRRSAHPQQVLHQEAGVCVVVGGRQGVVVVVERQGGRRVVQTRVHHAGRRKHAGDHHSPVNAKNGFKEYSVSAEVEEMC